MKQRKRDSKSRAGTKTAVLIGLAAGAVPLPALALNRTYVGGTDLWSTPSNWSPAGVPVSADIVTLQPGTNAAVTVTYDGSVTNTTITGLTIDSISTKTISLLQTTNTLTITGSEYVGYNRTGNLNLSGGTHTVSGTSGLFLGYNSAASGSVSLSSDGVLNVSSNEYVGYSGTGTFTQSGGSNTIGGFHSLSLGFQSGSSGTYTLSSGNLVTTYTSIGVYGNGVFIQDGGTHVVGFFGLGGWDTATGTYSLNGGALIATGGSIGSSGTGTFNQTGGTLAVTDQEEVGNGAGSTKATGVFNQSGGSHTARVLVVGSGAIGATDLSSGTYNLSNSASLAVDGEIISQSSNGTFNQSGGTHTVGLDLYLGYYNDPGEVGGKFNLSFGSLAVSHNEYLGYYGIGAFNQSGGSHTVGNVLFVGFSGIGTYNLSGSAALTVAGDMNVGYLGNGAFNQSGGSATVANNLTFGWNAGVNGTGTLSGGALTVAGGAEIIGRYGRGSFNQSGGTHSAGTIFLGYSAGATGRYDLTGGTADFTDIYVGGSSSGAGGLGLLNVGGGSLTAGSIQVYSSSSGTSVSGVKIDGGTVSPTALVLPDWSRLTFNGGALNLNGSISNPGNLIVGGNGGNATLNQSGGVVTADNLALGYSAGSTGTYNLADGAAAFPNIYVGGSASGAAGVGNLNVSGSGSMTISGALKVWNSGNSAINLSGGTLSVGALDLSGTLSRLNWTGGTLRFMATNGFDVAPGGQLGPSITLNGGMTLQADAQTTLGAGGTVYLDGGVLSTGQLDTGGDPSRLNWATGALNLTNSSLNVDSDFTSPLGSSLNIGAGQSLSVSGDVFIGGSSSSAGTVGTLAVGTSGAVTVGGNLKVWNNGSSAVNLSGGVISTASLDLSGNPSLLKWTAGTLNLTNSNLTIGPGGLLGPSLDLTVGKSLGVSGATTLASGSNISFSGGTLTTGSLALPDWSQLDLAAGTLNLSGGSSSNSGSLSVGHFNGSATVNQFGGNSAVNVGDQLILGPDAGSDGIYNVSDAAILAVTSDVIVGRSGRGTFNQSGGSIGATTLSLGYLGGSTGCYNLTGGNANLANVYVGGSTSAAGGLGTLTVGGSGSMAVSGTLKVWNSGSSAVNLAGGTLSVGSLDLSGTVSRLNWTAGTLNLTNSDLTVGPGGQLGASLDLTPGRTLGILGTTTVSSGGELSLSGGTLNTGVLALPAGSQFNFNVGALNLTNSSLTVGPGGLLGSSLTLTAGQALGVSGTTTVSTGGTLNLAGGSLNAGDLDINANPAGFNWTSGTLNFTASNGLIIDSIAANSSFGSTFTLVGNQTLTANNGESVGSWGNGTLNQTGGSNKVQSLVLGVSSGSLGRYNLGGSGVVCVSGDEIIGQHGSGIFNQSGGTHVPANLYLGYDSSSTNAAAGSGVYTMSSGASLKVAGSFWVGNFGTGTFNQTGGNATASAGMVLGASPGGTGTANLSGGTLNVSGSLVISRGDGASVANFNMTGGALNADTLTVNRAGKYVQTGGTATVPNFVVVSGGMATIGGGTGLATLIARSISADTFALADNSIVAAPLKSRSTVTSSIGTLIISTNNALLDVDRHDLLLDNSRTPFSTVHNNSNGIGNQGTGMWDRGYNYDPTQGYGLWDGASGITSSSARASHQIDGRISVGYIDGAVQNDPNIGDLGIGLPTNRILIRPSLNGDVNLDGVVDGNDIGIIIGLGYYGTGTAPHGWLDGDLNGDGVVDANDIGIIIGTGTFNNGSYGPKTTKAAKSTPTLSGSRGSVVQTTTVGSLGDGSFDYVYNPATGDVVVNYDGDTRITANNPLQRLKLASASGLFNPNAVNDSAFNFESKDNTLLDLSQTTTSIPDQYDLGDVLPLGLSGAQLANDLTLQFNVKGGGLGLKAGDVVVPEPSGLVIVGIGAIGLLARRRRRR